MTCLTICRKDLFAPIARRKFRDLLCALGSGSFFPRLWLGTVRVKRLTTKVSGVATEIGTAEKHRQPINRDQPNRERFASDARFALFALNGGVHLMHVCLFAVIHSLANTRRIRNFLVHCAVTFPARAMATVTLARPI